MASADARLPTVVLGDQDDELFRLLQEGNLLLLKYPTAAQAAFRALVAEGRRFARTPAGRRWKARLAGSTLAQRGHMLWEGSALDMLEERPDTLLPSALLDAIVGAIGAAGLPELLDRLFEERTTHAVGGLTSSHERVRRSESLPPGGAGARLVVTAAPDASRPARPTRGDALHGARSRGRRVRALPPGAALRLDDRDAAARGRQGPSPTVEASKGGGTRRRTARAARLKRG